MGGGGEEEEEEEEGFGLGLEEEEEGGKRRALRDFIKDYISERINFAIAILETFYLYYLISWIEPFTKK